MKPPGLPRLTFAGHFRADPSTVNNDPEHFDPSAFKSRYQTPGQPNGWWNPGGSGTWAFEGCTVQQVFYGDGTSCRDPKATRLSAPRSTRPRRPSRPGSSTSIRNNRGCRRSGASPVALGQPNAVPAFAGYFAVAAFADLATRVFGAGGGDAVLGGVYQSVIENIKWSDPGGSRFLKELAAGDAPGRLSIKFNVDGFNDQMGTTGFTTGRVVGSIGPYVEGEPKSFVAGRALPSTGNPSFNTAYWPGKSTATC